MKSKTSARRAASSAAAFMRRPSSERGLWMPGVSRNASCASSLWTTPSRLSRVVCGLGETIASGSRSAAFKNVDFPTFARPTMATVAKRMLGRARYQPLAPDAMVASPRLEAADESEARSRALPEPRRAGASSRGAGRSGCSRHERPSPPPPSSSGRAPGARPSPGPAPRSSSPRNRRS